MPVNERAGCQGLNQGHELPVPWELGKDERWHGGGTAAPHLCHSRARGCSLCSSQDSTGPRAAAPACTPAGTQPCRWSCNAKMGLSTRPKPPIPLPCHGSHPGAPSHGSRQESHRLVPGWDRSGPLLGTRKVALPSPVGAAEAVALAGGEVGLVDGLDVGLGVGDCPALRGCGTDSAAAERRAGRTAATHQPDPSPFRAKGLR